MNFFHVLPSNVAPDSFPRNHASAFSTPISNSYQLTGKWEMALMNMTYSGCINTFHHDHMFVEKGYNLKEKLETSEKAIRVRFSSFTNRRELVNNINSMLEGIAKIVIEDDGKTCKWTIANDQICLVLSKPLSVRFGLWHDVVTAWDVWPQNYVYFKDDPTNTTDEDYHIIIIPPSHKKTTVKMKNNNETIDAKELAKRFNERLKDIVEFKIEHGQFFVMTKPHNDNNTVVVFSPELHEIVKFRQAGLFGKGFVRFLAFHFIRVFKPSWKAYLYQLNDVEDFTKRMTIPITLSPHSFKRESDAISYLNEMMNDNKITFSLSKNKVLQVKIKDDDTRITFSDTVRDIFAFDQNTYKGSGTFTASDTFSLSRRIHYLYVYSNVSDYIRIGDTEAPLLAVIPFNQEKCVDLLQEKAFKVPMYVPVIQNPISQIDIAIYDGAGQLVPFATDAVTSIRLHFRQV